MHKSTRDLANFFKREINFERIDYQIIFKDAHFVAYQKEIRDEEEIKAYASQVSIRLISASKLKEESLQKLILFCSSFSEYCTAYGETALYSY